MGYKCCVSVLLLVCISLGSCFERKVVWDDDILFLEQNLGNFGPYRFVPQSQSIPDTCRVEQIQLFVRHGIRYPSPKAHYDWLESLVEKDSSLPWLTKKFVKDLTKEWLANGDMLNDRGKEEVLKFGRHLAMTEPFKQFRDQPEHTEVYINNNSTRLFETADYLTEGLFGKRIDRRLFRLGQSSTFTSTKPALEVGDDSKSRATMLKKSGLLTAINSKLARRLGVTDVSHSTLDGLWDACAFELSLYNRSDQFCSLFDKEDLQVIGFYKDLKLYWKGIDTSSHFEMLLWELQRFHNSDSTTRQTLPKVIIDVIHDHNLYPLIRHLNLMTAPCHEMKGDASLDYIKKPREFSERQLTWQGNVAVTLFNCTGVSDLVVRVALNEKDIALPIEGCQASRVLRDMENPALCELSAFTSFYQKHDSKSLPDPPEFFCTSSNIHKFEGSVYVELRNKTLLQHLQSAFPMGGNFFETASPTYVLYLHLTTSSSIVILVCIAFVLILALFIIKLLLSRPTRYSAVPQV